MSSSIGEPAPDAWIGIPITNTYESLHGIEEYLVSSDSKVLKRLSRHDNIPLSRCRRFRIDVQSLCAPLACATRAARLLPHNRQYLCLAPTSPTLQRETDTRPHGPRGSRESNRSRASSGDLPRRTQPRCSENVHDWRMATRALHPVYVRAAQPSQRSDVRCKYKGKVGVPRPKYELSPKLRGIPASLPHRHSDAQRVSDDHR